MVTLITPVSGAEALFKAVEIAFTIGTYISKGTIELVTGSPSDSLVMAFYAMYDFFMINVIQPTLILLMFFIFFVINFHLIKIHEYIFKKSIPVIGKAIKVFNNLEKEFLKLLNI